MMEEAKKLNEKCKIKICQELESMIQMFGIGIDGNEDEDSSIKFDTRCDEEENLTGCTDLLESKEGEIWQNESQEKHPQISKAQCTKKIGSTSGRTHCFPY